MQFPWSGPKGISSHDINEPYRDPGILWKIVTNWKMRLCTKFLPFVVNNLEYSNCEWRNGIVTKTVVLPIGIYTISIRKNQDIP